MSDRSRPWVVTVLLVVVVAAAAFSGPGDDAAVAGASPPQAPQRDPVLVAVERPVRARMSRLLEVPATVEPIATTEVLARVSGYVARVAVDIGADVAAAADLAEITVPEQRRDRATAEARVAARRAAHAAAVLGIRQAEAVVVETEQRHAAATASARLVAVEEQAAVTVLARQRRLFADAAATEEQVEAAQAKAESAAAAVAVAGAEAAMALAAIERARLQVTVAEAAVVSAAAEIAVAEAERDRLDATLELARLVSPHAARVAARTVDVGDLVQAGGAGSPPLFVLQRLDRVRVVFAVPEVDQPFVAASTAAELQLPGAGAPSMQATVTRVAGALRSGSLTMRAEIELDNGDQRWRPGQSVRVRIEIDPRPEALTIPARALLTQGGRPFVFVAREGAAVRVEITTGHDDGTRVEVRSGLAEDDAVVVAGQGLLVPGLPVRVGGSGGR